MKLKSFCRTFLLIVLSTFLAFSGAATGASLNTPEEMGMRRVAGQIYVDSGITPERTAELLQLVDESRRRVAVFFGQALARPNIVFCASFSCYQSFGAIGLGYTDGANVIISPYGQRAAIIAHELAHMELSVRIGGFEKVLQNVPHWFDEGLAVMVSQAEEFSETAWRLATQDGAKAPALSSLEATADWHRITGANGENMQLSYGTAHREVDRWFASAGVQGFHALLAALADNKAFDIAYSRIESMHADPLLQADASVRASEPDAALKSADWTNWQGNFARAAW